MKKDYITPPLSFLPCTPTGAAPLAFFSAATGLAALLGLAAGAATTSSVTKAMPDSVKGKYIKIIED